MCIRDSIYTIAEAIKDAVEMAVVNKYMQYLQKQGDTYTLPGGRTSDKDYEVQESSKYYFYVTIQ